jgi:proteasome lid subunit RPN8/RPN11
MFEEHIIDAVREHAAESAPRECCGLIVSVDGAATYQRCRNISENDEQFIMEPDDYAAAADKGQVLGIAHSHNYVSPEPSQADVVGCERSGLPWLIVNHPVGNYTVVEPTGYVAPLEGRQFVHGVFDCYAIIVDYYKQKLGIALPDFDREEAWWEKGYDLYMQNYEKAGFTDVTGSEILEHDVVIMQCRSPVPNHAGVYLGDSRILQHLTGRLSGVDVYGGYWQRSTVAVVRHKDLM